MSFNFGILLNNAGVKVTLGNTTFQPKSPVATSIVVTTSIKTSNGVTTANKSSLVASSATTTLLANNTSNFNVSRGGEYRIVMPFLVQEKVQSFNDALPAPAARFTPYEELSGISSSRPDIVSVSEFVPLFVGDAKVQTPTGELLDAQVKLMRLKQEATITLLKDLKKDQAAAEQLVKQQDDFASHLRRMKTDADFMLNVQTAIESTSALFDLRDQALKVDVPNMIGQFYSSLFYRTALLGVNGPYAPYSYVDLLNALGFTKARGFTGTKIYLQILNEIKKLARAGSDEMLGMDTSKTAVDTDPAVINKRTYKDVHAGLGALTIFQTTADITAANIHGSDARLAAALAQFASGFSALDQVFSFLPSDELSYANKLMALAREFSYSRALTAEGVDILLQQYGFNVSDSIGNQTLFDAVCGPLGTRITDDRSRTNQQALSSIASKTSDGKAVLTFDSEYVDGDDGSVYTPGASFYVSSATRPSNSGFSLDNASALATQLNNVMTSYVSFLGIFNLLPKTGNGVVQQSVNTAELSDPVKISDELYGLFVQRSTGFTRADVVSDPLMPFLSLARTDAQMRANFMLYLFCVANVANDGLLDVNAAINKATQTLLTNAANITSVVARTAAIATAATAAASTPDVLAAEARNTKVSATVDKLINNCADLYERASKDAAGATILRHSMRNFQSGLTSRIVAVIIKIYNTFREDNFAVSAAGKTRYSLATDTTILALAVQLVLDAVRRYVYVDFSSNEATKIANGFKAAATSNAAGNSNSLRAQLLNEQDTLQKIIPGVVLTTTTLDDPPLVASEFVSKEPLRKAIEIRLTKEDELVVRAAVAPLNAIKTCFDGIQKFVLNLESPGSVSVLNDVLTAVGDRKLVELLGDRGQAQLLADTVDDALSRIDPRSAVEVFDSAAFSRANESLDDDLQVFDDSYYTEATANVLKAAMADRTFSVDASAHSKIMSVGFPSGFSTKLRSRVKLSKFSEQAAALRKHQDVMIVDVYMIDVRYDAIVFKPRSFVFELSRFAVRNEKLFKNVRVGSPLADVVNAVPTKDYSDLARGKTVYGSSDLDGDASYAFMSAEDRAALIRNHVVSYILELASRTITGIPISEREMYIADPDHVDGPTPQSYVVKTLLKRARDVTFERRTNTTLQRKTAQIQTAPDAKQSNIGRQPVQPIEGAVPSLSTKTYDELTATVAAVGHLAGKRTPYSDLATASRRLLSPRTYERVFFVLVDPDDYEIDYEATSASSVGRNALRALQIAGEIEIVTETTGVLSRDVYRFRKRKESQPELAFEKFFAVVRPYEPTEKSTA